MDSGLSTSLQVQAVTSVGPGNFSEPMTVVVTPSDSSSSSTVVVVVVVVIVVFIIVLCSVVAGLLAYIFWWAAQHEACMHDNACVSLPIYVATRAFVCVCMHTQMQ